MYLYIYEGFQGGRDRQLETENLVKKSAELYIEEKGLKLHDFSREIIRLEHGKPVFKELPLNFSVSHTGDLWVCLMTDDESSVGVDIQMVKETRQERVMERYFTDDEVEYARANGEESFFTIWSRKEAYAKYTGRGLNKALADYSTLKASRELFMDLNIREGIKGACCVKKEGDLCLRMI